MKLSILALLASLIFPLFLGAKEADPLMSNSTAQAAMHTYEGVSLRIEQDRARALFSLNEKLVIELARAKSYALKAEKLDEAVAIDKKIKEVVDMNATLKAIIEGKKLPVQVVLAEKDSFAAKISAFAKNAPNLSASERQFITNFAERKTCWKTNMRSIYFIDENGNLGADDPSRKVSFPKDSVTFEDGVFTGRDGTKGNLNEVSSTGLKMNWMNISFTVQAVPYSEVGNWGSKPALGENKREVVKSSDADNDNTIFGRRLKRN